MSPHAELDLVTGAFSYSGAAIARRLLDSGRAVRTLTFHADRSHALQAHVEAFPYRFDDQPALARSLEGVHTLYNTYWVRFDHGSTTFATAIANSATLFDAAKRAGVQRIVHVSIANPSAESELPYYRGKALVEQALTASGVRHSIVRPTLVFGGDRDVLINNIAWLLRRLPIFALPGSGRYRVQPVHIEDVARICVEVSQAGGDVTVDAAGPETMTFKDLVQMVRRAVGSHSPIVHFPPVAMEYISRALGLVVHDVVLTRDEIRGLTSGLLASDQPPLGQIPFSTWVTGHGDSVGRSYANELQRHFRGGPASSSTRAPQAGR